MPVLPLFLRLACASTGLALLASTALAQDTTRVDQLVQSQVEAGQFSGTVLIGRDGQIIFERGYGLANREWNMPNDGQTKFRLGSVTKQFTAASILLLAEQGRLRLDDPVSTHIVDAPASWDGITLRHLLSHTSGIPNFTNFPDFFALNTQPATLDSLITRFRNKPLEFTPGTAFNYSNSGYVLLTAVIEKASSQSYEAFVAEKIFQPLGLSQTGYDRHETILPHRASGYTPSEGGMKNARYADMSIPVGAGALYSTARDLMKWNEALFGGKLLKQESVAQMIMPVMNGSALGLFVRLENGTPIIWHNGRIDGFNTYLAWEAETRTSIVVLGNMNGPGPDAIGNQLTTLVQGGNVVLPHERARVMLSPQELEDYVGEYALAPNFNLTIRLSDGKLQAQATGQSATDLAAEARDHFFLTAIDAQLHFTRDDKGLVNGLVLHQAGRQMPASRLPQLR